MEYTNLESIDLEKMLRKEKRRQGKEKSKGEKFRKRICIDEGKLKGIIFKITTTQEELESAYRTLHDSYVKKEYIKTHPSGMHITKYHELSGSTTFIGKDKENVVLTSTIFEDSSSGLPMGEIYKRELDKLRDKGRIIAEVGSLATHPEFNNKNQNIILHGTKTLLNYAMGSLKADDLVIAINPKKQWFYEHIYLFEQIGELKLYPTVNNNPAIAMRRNLNNIKEDFQHIYNGKPEQKSLYHFFFIKDSKCIKQ